MRFPDSVPRARPNLPFEKIVADIVQLYPEAQCVFIGGSFARDEMHTHSDVDIIIEFPSEYKERLGVLSYRDRPLWTKWNAWRRSSKRKHLTVVESNRRYGRGLTIDFILKVEGGPSVGQHQFRREQGLPTPAIILYQKES